MRILSPAKMARDLRAHTVPKAEFIIYIALFFLGIGFTIAYVLGYVDPEVYETSSVAILDKVSMVLIILFSLLIAFYANKKGDGKDFWYRYVALGIPIGLCLLIPALLLYAIAAFSGVLSIDSYGYPDLVIETLVYVAGIYLTWRYMRRAASGE